MRCERVMSQPVHSVAPGDPVDLAARRMRDANIGFLVVCDETGAAVGTLTDRDIVLRVLAEGLPTSTRVSEVMTADVIACRPTDEFFLAQRLMRERRVTRVVCLDEERRPTGVISLSDVARYEDGFRLAKTVRSALDRHGDGKGETRAVRRGP